MSRLQFLKFPSTYCVMGQGFKHTAWKSPPNGECYSMKQRSLVSHSPLVWQRDRMTERVNTDTLNENSICRPVFHTVLIGHLQQPYEPTRLKGASWICATVLSLLKTILKYLILFKVRRMNLHAKKSSDVQPLKQFLFKVMGMLARIYTCLFYNDPEKGP